MTFREQDGPRARIYLAGCFCRETRHVELTDDEAKALRAALSAYSAAKVLVGEPLKIDTAALNAKLKTPSS